MVVMGDRLDWSALAKGRGDEAGRDSIVYGGVPPAIKPGFRALRSEGVANSGCMDTPGGHVCGACKAGYEGCQASGCVESDECATNLSACDPLTICTNASAASYTCSACPSQLSPISGHLPASGLQIHRFERLQVATNAAGGVERSFLLVRRGQGGGRLRRHSAYSSSK